MAGDQSGTESENTFAELLNQLKKIVFSKHGVTTTWQHTTVRNDLNRDYIMELKEKDGRDILIGGIDLSDQLTRMQLIDEYYFVVHPVLYGKGKHFFESFELDKRVKLELFKTRPFQSGAIALFYRVESWDF